MKKELLAGIIGALLVMVPVQAEEIWRPYPAFLEAVCLVESSNGKWIRGDGGKSLGDFQIGRAAWDDVSQWRKARGWQTYDYRKNVLNRKINRLYAADYLTILRNQLLDILKREPTAAELYAAYNMGMANFSECRYRLARVNATTARKCQVIETFLISNRSKG